MDKKWESRELYEHPAKHNKGRFGRVVRWESGVYSLMIGNTTMSCPQDWAARIEREESNKARVTITLDPELIIKLDARAEREHRSRSQMVGVLIAEALGKS